MKNNKFIPINTFIDETIIDDEKVLIVIKDPNIKEFDEPTFARIKNFSLHNGVIEIKVMGKILKNAPDFARGFIGVAFHINEANSEFEALYIRPTNGRSDDPIRRNHSTQYFSYPDYKFDRLRQENPGLYESYADIGVNEWINLKIEIQDKQAKLYVNDFWTPALIVNDMKLGDITGGVGLWVETGTEGFFKDLEITNN